MKQTLKYLAFVAFFVAFIGFSPAFANNEDVKAGKNILVSGGEQYVEVNLDDLSNTSLLVGALGLDNQANLDEYAQIFYCKIYEDFFENDAQWMEVSSAIRRKYNASRGNIPLRYYFKTDIMIDRYDNDSKVFPLSSESVFNNINFLDFFTQKSIDRCGLSETKRFPSEYSLLLSHALSLRHLPVTSEAMLQKISELPIWSGVSKKLTAVFFVEISGYKEYIFTPLASKVILTGTIDRVAFYSDATLSTHIRTIDFKAAREATERQYKIPEFKPE